MSGIVINEDLPPIDTDPPPKKNAFQNPSAILNLSPYAILLLILLVLLLEIILRARA